MATATFPAYYTDIHCASNAVIRWSYWYPACGKKIVLKSCLPRDYLIWMHTHTRFRHARTNVLSPSRIPRPRCPLHWKSSNL